MNLPDIRVQIDSIDSQIIDLLCNRSKLVHKVGEVKKTQGLPIFAPEREALVYQRLMELNDGRLHESSIRAIFCEIMSAALHLEDDLTIAYLGPEGSWTHQAAVNKFGHSVSYLPQVNFDATFDAVLKGKADYGVLPVENSTEGTVTSTLDLLQDSPLKVCSQMYLQIEHALISYSSLNEIKMIYSHPQAFAQCRKWLQLHCPMAQLIETSSTAKAVEILKETDGIGVAAIASPLCAELQGAPILEHGIHDLVKNTTRFFVLGEKICPPTGKDRSSLLFVVKHEAGSLVRALKCLERNQVNLNSIQSRPCKHKEWEYVFYIDIDGHCENENVQKALVELESVCEQVKVLGSYPLVDHYGCPLK